MIESVELTYFTSAPNHYLYLNVPYQTLDFYFAVTIFTKPDSFDTAEIMEICWRSAGEIVDASLRKTFEYDAFAGKKIFTAVVLNNPVPVDPTTAGLFSGVAQPENPSSDQALLGETTNQIGTLLADKQLSSAPTE